MPLTILRVPPGNRRNTWVAFFALTGLLTAHTLLETARDALFLSRLPASRLPWAYLAIALMVVGLNGLNQRALGAFDRRRLFSVTLMAAAGITLGFYIALATRSQWILYALYVWSGLFATVAVVQFWLLLSEVFNVAQAKRVYPFIGLGGALGALVGSLGAAALVSLFDARALLAAAAGLMVVFVATPYCFQGSVDGALRAPAKGQHARGTTLRLIFKEVYLRRLLLLVLISTVVVTWVDFLFKAVVADVLEPAALGNFFARYYAALNGVSVMVQLLLAPWLLQRFGVNRALLLMPLLVLGTAAGAVASVGLVSVMILRGVDGALRHSVSRTSTELLFMPLASDVRNRCKGFIDGVGQRGGQALASVLFLGVATLGVGPREMALVALIGAAFWLLSVAGIKRHYLRMFREQLREGSVTHRGQMPELDLHSMEALLGALNSSEDHEVVAALEMFAEYDRIRLVPALILYHPSQDVVLRALELFEIEGRTDITAVLRRVLDREDPDVVSTALRLYATLMPHDDDILRVHLDHPSASVRVTALVSLVGHGFITGYDARTRLQAIVSDPDPRLPVALARAIREQDPAKFRPVLRELARHTRPEVLREVALGMADAPAAEDLPFLLQLLGRRTTRSEARRAFLAHGTEGLAFLRDALNELPKVSHQIRRHIPRTISPFGTAEAVALLVQRLEEEQDGAVRFKILRGLTRMLHDNPRLPIDRGTIERVLQATTERAAVYVDWRIGLEAALARTPSYRTRSAELLTLLLKEKERNAVGRLTRLLKLLRPQEDFQLIFQGLRSSDAKRRANGQELLEHMVPSQVRDPVLALVSDAPDTERVERLRRFLPEQLSVVNRAVLEAAPADKPFLSQLSKMLHDSSEIVCCLTAYFVGECALTELGDELTVPVADSSSPIDDVMRRVYALLGLRAQEAIGA